MFFYLQVNVFNICDGTTLLSYATGKLIARNVTVPISDNKLYFFARYYGWRQMLRAKID